MTSGGGTGNSLAQAHAARSGNKKACDETADSIKRAGPLGSLEPAFGVGGT